MSGAMIVGGRDSETPVKERAVRLAPGLGLLEEVVIDQHFAQRGRLGRLLAVVAQNPSVLGLGIDEDTAVIVFPDGRLRVLGRNAVTVVDGSALEHSNVSESDVTQVLALAGVVLHMLPSGYGYDLKLRKPLLRLQLDNKAK